MRISENLSPEARKVLATARNALFEGSILDAVTKAIAASEPRGLPHVFGSMVVKLVDRANADGAADPAELYADEGVAEHLIEDLFTYAVKKGVEIPDDELPELYDETMDSVEEWANVEVPEGEQAMPEQPMEESAQPRGFIGGA